MPIRNWGGGGDHSDTFLSLQDEFIRRAQAAQDAASARRSGGSGGGGGGGGGPKEGSSEFINEGAGVIVDGMSRGTTNWRNLYAFYVKQLKNTPRNSPTRAQVQRQIDNVAAVAAANGISLAGGVAPAQISMAEPGTNRYDADQDLTPAVDAAINDQILYVMATRNGIYPGNERPLDSYVGRMIYEGTVKELRAGMIADAKLYELALEDIKNGGTTVRDPVSGNNMQVTPELALNMIYQYGETQMALAGLERGMGVAGAFDDRMSMWESKQDTLVAPIISERVFPLMDDEGNAVEPDVEGIAGYMDQRMSDFNVLRNLALDSSDPTDMLRSLQSAGRLLGSSMRDLTKFVESMPEGIEVAPYVLTDLEYSNKISEFLGSVTQMTPEEAMAAGAALIQDHPGDNYFLSRGDIMDMVGNPTEQIGSGGGAGSIDDRVNALEAGGAEGGAVVGAGAQGRYSPGWSGVTGALAAEQGLLVTKAVRGLNPDEVEVGPEQFVYVAPFGQSEPVAVPMSQAADYLAGLSGSTMFEEGGLSSGAFPSREMVRLPSGRREVTLVWREMSPPSPDSSQWWAKKNSRGETVWATQADREAFGSDPILAGQQGWSLAPFAGLENLNMVQSAEGNMYYVNAVTGQAYPTPPINGLPRGFDFHPTDLINPDGSVKDSYRYVTHNGMFWLTGIGVDRMAADNLTSRALASGEVALGTYRWVNSNGVAMEPPTIEQLQADMSNDYYGRRNNTTGAITGGDRYSEDIRNRYDRNSRQLYADARRDEFRASNARAEWMAAQTAADTHKDGFQDRYASVVENSVEIGRRQTGIRFGPGGEKRPRTFDSTPDIENTTRTTLPPMTLDYVRPRTRPVVEPTQPMDVAPVRPAAAPKTLAGKPKPKKPSRFTPM